MNKTTVAIYGSRRQEPFLTRVLKLLDSLVEHNASIIMHGKLYRHLRSLTPMPLPVDKVVDDDAFEADVALSIGGDGTFLKTAKWVGNKMIPIAGINTGHLGYLAAFTLDNVSVIAGDITTGNYIVDQRTLLTATNDAGIELEHPNALNEVAILRPERVSMISSEVCIAGASSAHYQADGLIIATPTGSTGYNLSVGGPIVEPTAPVFVIAPVAAHSLTMRPMIVGDNGEITITTTCRGASYLLNIDGYSTPLPAGTTVTVKKAPFVTRIIHQQGHTFVDTLRNKLSWGK